MFCSIRSHSRGRDVPDLKLMYFLHTENSDENSG